MNKIVQKNKPNERIVRVKMISDSIIIFDVNNLHVSIREEDFPIWKIQKKN